MVIHAKNIYLISDWTTASGMNFFTGRAVRIRSCLFVNECSPKSWSVGASDTADEPEAKLTADEPIAA